MGTIAFVMSFGPAMSAMHLAGASAITFGLCVIQHQTTLQSGLQPATISAEWQAATVGYMLNRKLEATDYSDKTFVQNPIAAVILSVYLGLICSDQTLPNALTLTLTLS